MWLSLQVAKTSTQAEQCIERDLCDVSVFTVHVSDPFVLLRDAVREAVLQHHG